MNVTSILRLLSFLFLLILHPAYGQVGTNINFCGTGVPSQQWEKELNNLIDQRFANTANKTTQSNYIIPVIVHVIHGGQPIGTYPNISQSQINSQIPVLNNDFAGSGFNSFSYPPLAFSNWASSQNIPVNNLDVSGRIKIADCGIQFCLATLDPAGNVLTEPGIDRINWQTRSGWVDPLTLTTSSALAVFIESVFKPQTIWDVTKYLNIWISDRDPGVGLYAYASLPPLTGIADLNLPLMAQYLGTNTTDGVWCFSKCFGSAATFPGNPTTYQPGYNHGRTCTHEIGHYLGLRHIWGDAPCNSDYCNDTPPAAAGNYSPAGYPCNPGSCNGPGNSPNGEMFMNFMDYSIDTLKYMFTQDQVSRIQTVMANSPFRKFLGTQNVCGAIPSVASFQNTYPACLGVDMALSNSSSGFPAPTYIWTCPGASFNPSAFAASPILSFSTPGIYVITLLVNNGISNNAAIKTVTVTSSQISLSASSPVICAGELVDLFASGSDTYTWQPNGIVSYSAVYTPAQTEVFTCKAKGVNGCQSTATISVIVDACTAINQFNAEQKGFNINPNPANEILYVNYSSDKNAEVIVDINDALGNLVTSQNLLFDKEKQNQALNISFLPRGIYFVKLTTSTHFDELSGGGSGRSGEAMLQFVKLVKE